LGFGWDWTMIGFWVEGGCAVSDVMIPHEVWRHGFLFTVAWYALHVWHCIEYVGYSSIMRYL